MRNRNLFVYLKESRRRYFYKNVDFSLIDGFTKVTDKDAAVYTRKIALEEGIFVGNSAGAL